MIDLALKMLLDEKARFAATVLGVGFAAGLVLVQVGLFFRTSRQRQYHDRQTRRRPLDHGAEHAQRRLRQSVSRELCPASSIDSGCGARR